MCEICCLNVASDGVSGQVWYLLGHDQDTVNTIHGWMSMVLCHECQFCNS